MAQQPPDAHQPRMDQAADDTKAAHEPDDLNVSPASPSDLEDDMPTWQPGEGEGPTPGE
jgi:hypothetical protein